MTSSANYSQHNYRKLWYAYVTKYAQSDWCWRKKRMNMKKTFKCISWTYGLKSYVCLCYNIAKLWKFSGSTKAFSRVWRFPFTLYVTSSRSLASHQISLRHDWWKISCRSVIFLAYRHGPNKLREIGRERERNQITKSMEKLNQIAKVDQGRYSARWPFRVPIWKRWMIEKKNYQSWYQ